jgi:hypothetical protein
VSISRELAQKLAYYKADQGVGVLAPRGWYCFGTYGSGGESLFVSPRPIDAKRVFSEGPGLTDAAVQASYSYGGTSGRFTVAEVIARVFPAYRDFVTGVMQGFEQPQGSYTFGPYPADTMTYKSNALVEYRTPARTEGLGTHSWLRKNDRPISGAAILVGGTPDLLFLAVRLPPGMDAATDAIIARIEHDAARLRGD